MTSSLFDVGVGGVSAVLRGAPVTTLDLDVVHACNSENIVRLLAALQELEAVPRLQPERSLRPGESHLAGPGHQLLLTRFGPLDMPGPNGDQNREMTIRKIAHMGRSAR